METNVKKVEYTCLSVCVCACVHVCVCVCVCVCTCVSHSLCVSLQLDQCGLPSLAFCPAPEGGAIPATANQKEGRCMYQPITQGKLLWLSYKEGYWAASSITSSRQWLYWTALSIPSSRLWLYWAAPSKTSTILVVVVRSQYNQ